MRNELSIIDVRSPSEFAHAHIPGAVNIPIFNDDERAKVGTTYKKQGKNEAVELGLELVGPKLAGFVRSTRKLLKNNSVLVHCWRGGMRSGSFAWLLSTAGINVFTLEGGYKAYRNFVLSTFEKDLNICILGGETGSGKTDVLRELHLLGEQTIDLELLACHKGSSFGAIGQPDQPSVEQFENLLCDKIYRLDYQRPCWLEDESRSIGRVFIPAPIWEKMNTAPFVRMDVPEEIRVSRLVVDYGNTDQAILAAAIGRISKKLGGQHANAALKALECGDLKEVVRITLNYYDKAYRHASLRRRSVSHLQICGCTGDPLTDAQLIIASLNKQKTNS